MAADLLSQAEHGTDSQVVLVAVNLSNDQLDMIQVTNNYFYFLIKLIITKEKLYAEVFNIII